MMPKGRTTKPRVEQMISKRSEEAERGAEARGAGRKPSTKRRGAELCAATSGETKSEGHLLMEEVVERNNLQLAYQRVVENKGAPGVDEISVPEFKDWIVPPHVVYES
jgi:RNA-directed DNA polymerase